MFIAVVGLSHRTAPVEIREQLSIPEPLMEEALNQLCACSNIQEAAILSTCNRLEVYVVTDDAENGVRQTMQFLADFKQLDLQAVRPHLFTLLYRDAVMHLMRVGAGLDSLVLGEGQILAQVKTTLRLGQDHSSVGRILNKVFKSVITAGKRVRSEVKLSTGAVSISSAAVELAVRKHPVPLAQQEITIVGAGKMSRLLVQHLLSKGANHITLVNRSLDNARELASHFEAEIRIEPLEAMLACVAQSHLVFTSTGATEPILDRARLEGRIPSDQGVMMIDISVPRNIAADISDLAGVTLFNVDDLAMVVEENKAHRLKLVESAQVVLEEETELFWEWWRSLETVPTISSLRHKAETIREQELEKALSRLGKDFAEKHLEVIEALTRGIVNKILHDPVVQLRAQRDIEARRAAMRTLQMLFNLDDPLQLQAQQEQS